MVENGSSDNTAAEAESMADVLRAAGWKATVVRLEEPNYGAAMREGFRRAGGDWIINFDIDYFSGPFVAGLAEQTADVVIASKRAPGSDDRRGAIRRLATLSFNLLLRGLVGSNLTDTHGIKAFRNHVIRDIEPQTHSTYDLFDTELVLRAERAGYRIAEVPIIVEERRATRSSLLKRVPRTLVGLIRLRWRFARDRPDA